jgi:hypothetical protein
VDPWFVPEPERVVSEREIGWLLAQGWTITAVNEDDNKPQQKWYTIKRTGFAHQNALDELLQDYVALFNEGRSVNDERFDDLVVMYSDLLGKTHTHLDRAAAASNTFETLFVNTLDSIQTQIDFYLDQTRVASISVFDEAVVKLNEFAALLTQLGSGYDDYKTAIESILTTQTSSLSQFVARAAAMLTQLSTDHDLLRSEILALEAADDATLATHAAAYEAKLDALEAAVTTVETQLLALVSQAEEAYLDYRTQVLASISTMEGELNELDSSVNGLLDDLDTEITGHTADYQGILDLFVSDYTTHATTARALLVDLGTTELARINEQFDNLLAGKAQQLVNRGFYSSALIAQTDARVERERNEAISALNDRLAREKLDNEHKLYGELFQVRDKQTAGLAYMHSLTAAALRYRADWSARLYEHAAALQQMTVGLHGSIKDARSGYIATAAGVREKVFGWGQQAKQAVLAGKDQIYQFRQAIAVLKQGNRVRFAESLNQVRMQSVQLYGQELAARNAVDAFAAAAREKIMTLLNGYIAQHAEGVAQYAQMTLQSGQFLDQVRQRAAAMAMETRYKFCAGLSDVNAAQQNLIRYQLDTRNNLAVGLFSFMERRTDEYVDFPHITQLIVDLAASGPTQWAD